jgi:predicted amidohydrolase YtcJ
MEPRLPYVSAVAVKGDRILAAGNDRAIKSYANAETILIDARGSTVLPGLIDAHVHFMGTGLDAGAAALMGTASRSELFDRLRKKEAELNPGEWLRGFGYDETKFEEKSLPGLAEFNAVFPGRPVFLSRIDAHSCFLNDVAYDMVDPAPSVEGIVTEGGTRTGVLREAANAFARKRMSEELTTDDIRRKAMHTAAQEALRAGVTTLHALEGGSLFSDKDVDVMLKFAGSLPIRTLLYHQITDVEQILKEGLPRIGGCITIDGSLGSYTAALSEPYADKPEVSGTPYFTPREIEDFVMEAHAAGLQIAMHTIGDHAIELLMQAYEKALSRYPKKDHRHRFEHFTVPTYDQIIRAAKLGVCISVQPSFDYLTSKTMMPLRLGEERLRRAYPFRTMMEEGLILAGGSDSNITPLSPLFGITSCMVHSQPMQRLSLYEALKLFTVNAAYIGFEEEEKGSIKIGKYADIVIIEGDITKTEADQIQYMQVLKTIVGGDVKFEA